LTDRIAATEHVARERLVHDHHPAGFEIERLEATTVNDRRAKGAEEAAGNVDQRASTQTVRGSTDRRIDFDPVLELVLHRKTVGECDVLHTRFRAEPLFQLIESLTRETLKCGRIGHVIFAVHGNACRQVSLAPIPSAR
jgi:hypothetical protein